MIRLDVLNEVVAWQQAWHDLPVERREVYSSPGYHAACARWERATAHCLRATTATGSMLYPYLAHPTADGRHDAQTAYGYGGPIFVGAWSGEERRAALDALAGHLRATGAVAEFVRCHTEWADAEELRKAGYRAFQVRTNVECELTGAEFDAAWSSGARRNVRKALASGLKTRIGSSPEDLAAFARLYAMTAERLQMAAGYRFDSQYFRDVSAVPNVRLVVVETPERQVVAGAMVFVGGRLAHYHLGASDFAFQERRPNDLLYHGMATLAREAGCERIVWGGGMSNDPDDSLFRFKTHFGAIRRPVYCAGRAIDQAAYDRLCADWHAQNPGRESKMLLKYRA
jgi:hypothetical protein